MLRTHSPRVASTARLLLQWGPNHLKERLLDQAQARTPYPPPPFGGHLRSIPQGMILDVQPLVKSLFCLTKRFPNGFFDFEASIPLKLETTFLSGWGGGMGGWGGVKSLCSEGFELGLYKRELSGPLPPAGEGTSRESNRRWLG